MPDDKPSYKAARKMRGMTVQAPPPANIISPKGEDAESVRKGLSKVPELSGGASWVDPKSIIRRRGQNPDRMRYEPEDVEQPGEVIQKI